MKHMDRKDFTPLMTLLDRIDEFNVFFEQTATTMSEWRQEITQQASSQQAQLNAVKAELDRMQQVISDAGLECFRLAAEETVSQGTDYLQGLKNTEQQLLRQIHDHRAELTRISQHAMTLITKKTSQVTSFIDKQLSQQNDILLKPIMHQQMKDICPPIAENPLTEAPNLKHVEWRAVSLTLVSSLITALIFGLYVSGEYPWEMHQQATSERGAGKALLNAWPTLTHHEKNKILYRAS